jgi:hypothetical protein
MPTHKGYGFATSANASLQVDTAAPVRAIAGDFPLDSHLTDDEREEILEKNPLAFYVRPERQPMVLIVGPAEWAIEDLVGIKDYLSRHRIKATTYRPVDGLTLDDVVTSLNVCDCIVLVTGTEPNSWGSINQGKIKAAAERLDKRSRILSETTWMGAADAASALVR